MSEEFKTSEPFTEGERKILAAWTTPPPPADLYQRVLSHAQSPRQRRWPIWGGALAATILLGVFLILLSRPTAVAGHLVANQRKTAAIGRRAVVVAEANSELRWQVDSNGSAKVDQLRGNVFFRVEHGGPFVVHTSAGTVRVLGTCFRVEVISMKASRAGAVGAGIGAAAATVILVTVYEGKVLTASTKGEQEVSAGQIAEVEAGRIPRVTGEIQTAAKKKDKVGAATQASPTRHVADGHPMSASAMSTPQLRAEKERLEEEVQQLKQQLEHVGSKAKRGKMLNLTKEELVEMAKRCELRWDMPPLGIEPPKVEGRALKELGFTKEERAEINRVYADYHRDTVKALRDLYIEVTGDKKNALLLSPGSLIDEIHDKSPPDEIRHVFQRLARERAGMLQPSVDPSQSSPVERLYRLLTTVGDRVEKQMGAAIGPDLARRYRELADGFGSRSRSNVACPKR